MGQILRSTERISSIVISYLTLVVFAFMKTSNNIFKLIIITIIITGTIQYMEMATCRSTLYPFVYNIAKTTASTTLYVYTLIKLLLIQNLTLSGNLTLEHNSACSCYAHYSIPVHSKVQ